MTRFALFLLFFSDSFALHATYVCPSLNLKNGHVRVRQRGRFARFSCNNGYILAGEKYAACVRGEWELPLPKCVRPSCSKMRTPQNAYVHASHRGAVMHFSCKPEYVLRGATTSYCDGRRWDANPPVCQKGGTRPAYSCDFETEDICGWEHDVNHDFDWRRFRYNTPSGHVGTGPSFDHTKGEGKDGYYMYIESSSRFENDTARLISPFYDKTENNTCFEFYYHMYGATMGTLRVYLKKADEPWEFDPKRAFFEKTGNQGDEWFRSVTSLGAIDQDFQIVIEGVRGSSYVSDIAIDDVRVIFNCNPDAFTTESTTDSSTTETFPVVESCENRCGAIGGTPADALYQTPCDCDVDCTERNSCCLDYIAFCVLSGTDAVTSTTGESEVETTTETERFGVTATTTAATTKKPKPVIVVLTQATTEKIVERTRPSTTPARQTTRATTKKTVVKTTKPNAENEIIKIVRLTTAAVSTMTGVKSDVVEVPKVTEPFEQVDEELMRHLSPSNQMTGRISGKPPVSTHVFWIVLGVAAAVVVVLIVAVVVARRRRYFFRVRCAGGFNGADSQSDVRFLTGDEVLDFRLARGDRDDDDF